MLSGSVTYALGLLVCIDAPQMRPDKSFGNGKPINLRVVSDLESF